MNRLRNGTPPTVSKNAFQCRTPIVEGVAGTSQKTHVSVRDELRRRLHYFMAGGGFGNINFTKALDYPPIRDGICILAISMNEGETFSDRARDDHYKTYIFERSGNEREMRPQIASVVEELLREGMAKELVDAGVISFGRKFDWKDRGVRVKAIMLLLELLGKSAREDACTITGKDFCENGLGGLLTCYYNNSPYLALKEIYPDLGEWEMPIVPQGYWNGIQNRISAIRHLLEKLDKKTREDACTITAKDFHDNGLGGLLTGYYSDSPYLALKEVYPDLEEWEMSTVPRGYWEDRQNRINVIRRLLEKLDKKTREDACTIAVKNFYDKGLGGLLMNYYKGSPYLALREIYPDLEVGEMENRPRVS